MSEISNRYWRSVPRARAPYAQREDEHESRVDRTLLDAGARLRRPFGQSLRLAAAVAVRVEREQAAVDALSERKLLEAAGELRMALRRRGFAAELTARAFALVRAAAGRTTGLRHFPVQLMGGCVMLHGMLAEMDTGEGKTLTATLPAATAALAGVPVHVVTVNDYLAQRDAGWMRPIYAALGLTAEVVSHGQKPDERRAAYGADIVYVTNKDLGFDFLRDGLTLAGRSSRERLVLEKLFGRNDRSDRLLLRGLGFAIIDEADSVLIDEARTPLIISGEEEAAADAELYRAALAIARDLDLDRDYRIDRRVRAARLTDAGRARVRELAGTLPGAWRSARGREELTEQALAGLALFELDTHYLVREGKVQIVDEYSGRVLPDRTWERGLQQLIEVKEACTVSPRRKTLARITYQRLFRRFLRLSGMTGTAREVAPELDAVYGLKVVRIPTHRPGRRSDLGATLHATSDRKWTAVAETVARLTAGGRPVLVGTRSVAASEAVSARLAAARLEHVVLNARQDGDEATVVARAGEPGRVTVATNMAGRGTDIKLASQVVDRGGLHVILTEYHESGRIDRQLQGRCARQGDPGACEAIVSLEDDLFRKHAPGFTRVLRARYADAAGALPGWTAGLLRRLAQGTAEGENSRARQATLELDRRLDQAFGFTGRVE